MPRFLASGLLLAAILSVAACQSVENKAVELSQRSFTYSMIGRSYESVASRPDYDADTLGRIKLAGRPVGEYVLPGGDIVQRHAKLQLRSTSSADAGLLLQKETNQYAIDLYYFRVGVDGMINDVAYGSLPGGTMSCFSAAGGLIGSCDDAVALQRDIRVFDAAVKTREGQPVTVWGSPDAIAPLAAD